jgi:hypothetical protein
MMIVLIVLLVVTNPWIQHPLHIPVLVQSFEDVQPLLFF